MRKVGFAVTLTLIAVITSVGAAKHDTKHNFQKGTLISVTSDERLFDGTTIRWAIFTVQVGDLVYTARGERIRPHSGDPAHGLVVGDTVQVAIDGDNLLLLQPDGKELKTKITKRARPSNQTVN